METEETPGPGIVIYMLAYQNICFLLLYASILATTYK